MKPILAILLLTASLQAQTYITIDTSGNKILHIDDSPNYMAMVYYDDEPREQLKHFVFVEIPELDIKPSTTIYGEPEKFIPKYHTETLIKDIKESDGILYGIRFGLLIIASLFYFYGLKNITIFSTHNELRQ
jgi:hypothetical protein